MRRTDDKSQVQREQMDSEQMDVVPELPAPQKTDDNRSQQMKEEQAKGEAGKEGRDASRVEVDRLKAECDALFDRVARTQAEFENTRKRLIREQQEFKSFAVADALQSLLPALDSFDWALQAPPTSLEEFRNGIDLVRRQLHEALGKLGLSPVPAKGEPFDPHLHEAIEMAGMTESSDNREDNRVVEELRRGYKLGDRLLRPAMVVVGRGQRD